jgi:hypothetical protein
MTVLNSHVNRTITTERQNICSSQLLIHRRYFISICSLRRNSRNFSVLGVHRAGYLVLRLGNHEMSASSTRLLCQPRRTMLSPLSNDPQITFEPSSIPHESTRGSGTYVAYELLEMGLSSALCCSAYVGSQK